MHLRASIVAVALGAMASGPAQAGDPAPDRNAQATPSAAADANEDVFARCVVVTAEGKRSVEEARAYFGRLYTQSIRNALAFAPEARVREVLAAATAQHRRDFAAMDQDRRVAHVKALLHACQEARSTLGAKAEPARPEPRIARESEFPPGTTDAIAVLAAKGRPDSEDYNPDGRFVYAYETGNTRQAFLFDGENRLVRVRSYCDKLKGECPEQAIAPRAADAPQLTPEEEKALGDELLFCVKVMGTLSQVPGQSEDRKEAFKAQGLLFTALTLALLPKEEVEARKDTVDARLREWVDRAVEKPEELTETVRACAQKRDANRGWLLARRDAARQAAENGPRFAYAGSTWVHRWSKQGQHEFTPADQPDLEHWTRMVTVNLHPQVSDQEGLPGLVSSVTRNYERVGRVIRSVRKAGAGTEGVPAEHLVSAVLEAPGVAEAACARILFRGGTGLVVVASRRWYGANAKQEATAWLEEHGADEESALMAFDAIPSADALRALPEAP